MNKVGLKENEASVFPQRSEVDGPHIANPSKISDMNKSHSNNNVEILLAR